MSGTGRASRVTRMRRPAPGGRTGSWARRAVGTLAVLAALATAACGAGDPSSSAGAADATGSTVVAGSSIEAGDGLPQTVRSADGRSVVVDDVERIVSLSGSVTEVLFDLGLGEHVVGRDVTATTPEAADIPLVTRGHDVSAESVLSLRPTLVLASDDTGPPEALEQIRNVGVPVVVFDHPESVDGIADRIRHIGSSVGLATAAEELVEDTEAELAALRDTIPADADHPRVAFLYLRGSAGVYLIGGPGNGTDSLIEAVGGRDAGTDAGLTEEFTALTSEALVDAAPDAFLLTTTGLESVGGIDGLLELPGIAQTPAGAARRIVAIEDGLLFSFGSRTPEAIRSIIGQLYRP